MHKFSLLFFLVFSYSLVHAQIKNVNNSSAIKSLEKQKQEAVAKGDFILAHELKQEIEKLGNRVAIKNLEKQISEAVDKQEFVLAATLKKELDKKRELQEEIDKVGNPAAIKNLEKQISEAVDKEDFGLAASLKEELDKKRELKKEVVKADNLATIENLEKRISEAVDKEDFGLAARLKKELDKERGISAGISAVARPATETSSRVPDEESAARSITEPANFKAGKSSLFDIQKESIRKGKWTSLTYRSSMDIKDENGILVGRQIDFGIPRPVGDWKYSNTIDSKFSARMTDDFKFLILKNGGRISTFKPNDFRLIDSKKTLSSHSNPELLDEQGRVVKEISVEDKYLNWGSGYYNYTSLSFYNEFAFTVVSRANTHYGGKDRGYYYSFEYDHLPVTDKGHADRKNKVYYSLRLRNALAIYNK